MLTDADGGGGSRSWCPDVSPILCYVDIISLKTRRKFPWIKIYGNEIELDVIKGNGRPGRLIPGQYDPLGD
jgi:hypothetical protein